MLKFVILIIIFLLVFWFLYRKILVLVRYWTSELSEEPSLEDRDSSLKVEGGRLKADIKQRQKELEQEYRKVNRIKRERNF